MANNIYDTARYRLLTATLNWLTANLQLVALGGTPEFVPTDEDLATIVARDKPLLGTSMPIPIKTVSSNGTAQTGPVVIPNVGVGANVTHFIMLDGDSLVLFIDEAIELPFVPNGLDMVIQPDWLAQRGWWRP